VRKEDRERERKRECLQVRKEDRERERKKRMSSGEKRR
jgi:hypothetical protein